MIFEGEVKEAVDRYMGPDNLEKNEIYWDDIANAPGNENIRLKSITIRPLHGSIIDIDSGIEISTVFYNTTAGKSLDFTLYLFTLEGVCLFETGVILSSAGDASAGYFSTKGIIPPHLLNAGIYKVNLLFGESQRYVLYKIEDVISFEVDHTATGRGSNMSRTPGVIRPALDWSFKFLSQ
jgi:lipopolysaccharide transport system ATP-binding protein